ncbi:MAG: crossover junction endodeoxyribonuclease RuvC [Gammaproteobacteria bacterium]|nr:crossover junction endodeoxyribonuclease RuvC [Gammaproteobacteria bacterium]
MKPGTTILGIDPGSRVTGFGIIIVSGDQMRYCASGCIRTDKMEFNRRLEEIYNKVGALINEYSPAEVCLERVFVHRNADSALKLGHARAAAMCAVFSDTSTGTPLLAEYSPRQVKQAVAGYGAAEKDQVKHMVSRLLALQGDLQSDAADALAVAVCHANSRRAAQLLGQREAVQ